jgi:hypothetical protein
MVSESLSDALRNSARPVFLFGSVPPKDGTSIEKAKEICVNFSSKSAVLATDGFVVYDIQDETARTALERPFPFRKCMDAAQYASFFPAASGKQCIVYKSVVETKCDDFEKWLDSACLDYLHNTYNLVGCTGLDLNEVGKMMKSRDNVSFGCVCSPERHTLNQNESTYMVMKSEFGADWFTTQGIFSAAPISKLLNDYGDICRQKCLMPKKVLLTFAPCGRPKTMAFIKWLGMYVPEEKEKRILAAAVPAQESVILLNEILTNILEQTRNSGVPLGIIVESLSVYNDEVDAAHELFQLLQVTCMKALHFICLVISFGSCFILIMMPKLYFFIMTSQLLCKPFILEPARPQC